MPDHNFSHVARLLKFCFNYYCLRCEKSRTMQSRVVKPGCTSVRLIIITKIQPFIISTPHNQENVVSGMIQLPQHTLLFGCDSSLRSPNVSLSVCLSVTLATTVLKLNI